METRLLSAQSPGDLDEAAALLRSGGLVAFPTETVYGLGGLALEPLAVRAIYAAKGRPATNPVIVHVLGEKEARPLCARWPLEARQLAARFWPGPLTLVLPRTGIVPDEVTAGGPTVAGGAPSPPPPRPPPGGIREAPPAPSAEPPRPRSPAAPAPRARGLLRRPAPSTSRRRPRRTCCAISTDASTRWWTAGGVRSASSPACSRSGTVLRACCAPARSRGPTSKTSSAPSR